MVAAVRAFGAADLAIGFGGDAQIGFAGGIGVPREGVQVAEGTLFIAMTSATFALLQLRSGRDNRLSLMC
jgi:hypothetical protein